MRKEKMTEVSPDTKFQPGKSGNPRGRPPKGTYGLGEAELRKLLKTTSKCTDEAMNIIIQGMREGKSLETKMSCAKYVIEKMIQIQKELDVKLHRGRPDKEDVPAEDDDEKDNRKPVTLKLTM